MRDESVRNQNRIAPPVLVGNKLSVLERNRPARNTPPPAAHRPELVLRISLAGRLRPREFAPLSGVQGFR
jgi:hypothetical protein